MDAFTTPFGATCGTMPGIQLHATMADNLLSNRFIWPSAARVRVASVVLAGLVIGCLAAFLPFTLAARGNAARHRRLDVVRPVVVQERPVARHDPAVGHDGDRALCRDRLSGTSSKGARSES